MPFEYCNRKAGDQWKPAWDTLMELKLKAAGYEDVEKTKREMKQGHVVRLFNPLTGKVLWFKWRDEERVE